MRPLPLLAVRNSPRTFARKNPHRLLLACVVLATLNLATPLALAGPRIQVDRDIPVHTSDGARITVDVWRLPKAKPRRTQQRSITKLQNVALLIHGGGWHSGDKRQWEQSRWAQRLVKNGWLVVNVNYRLACTARVPRQERAARDNRLCGHAMRDSIIDVKTALRFTSKHARTWGGNPAKIVLFGASAGGHLAMLAGSDPQRPKGVRAVIAIGPPTDLTWVGMRPTLPLYASARQSIGCDLGSCADLWQAASPINQIDPTITPPTWVFNSERDPITSIVPIRSYLEALRAQGISTRLVRPRNSSSQCHGPIPCKNEKLAVGRGDMFQAALSWLRAYT